MWPTGIVWDPVDKMFSSTDSKHSVEFSIAYPNSKNRGLLLRSGHKSCSTPWPTLLRNNNKRRMFGGPRQQKYRTVGLETLKSNHLFLKRITERGYSAFTTNLFRSCQSERSRSTINSDKKDILLCVNSKLCNYPDTAKQRNTSTTYPRSNVLVIVKSGLEHNWWSNYTWTIFIVTLLKIRWSLASFYSIAPLVWYKMQFLVLFFFFFTPNTVKAAKVSFVFVVDEMIVISVRGDTSLRLFFF